MGNSWQTEEQKVWFDKHLASFVRSSEEGKLKDVFWPAIVKKWFEQWPLSNPPAELVVKEGSVEKAVSVWKSKKVEVSVTKLGLSSTQAYLLDSKSRGSSSPRPILPVEVVATSTLKRAAREGRPKSRCT